MKRLVLVSTMVFMCAISLSTRSANVPGMDSCTAAMIGVQFASTAYWDCVNGPYPPPPCDAERLQLAWAVGNLVLYCNFEDTP